MDKRTAIGLILIFLIFLGFNWYTGRQQAEVAAERARVDSINAAKTAETLALEETIVKANENVAMNDSTATRAIEDRTRMIMGDMLYQATKGEKEYLTLSNDKIEVTLLNKGAIVSSVILKEYTRYDGAPLELFDEADNIFDLGLFTNQSIHTQNFYFKPTSGSKTVTEGSETISYRLYADSASYIEYSYTLAQGSYNVDFDVRFVGMENMISPLQNDMTLDWSNNAPQQERGWSYENQYTTLAYSFPDENDIEELSIGKGQESEEITTGIKWVAFKQQFFSAILTANDKFANGDVSYTTYQPTSGMIKNFRTSLKIDYDPAQTDYGFTFYFGPNDYKILRSLDGSYEKLIPLGWGIMGWINRFIVIPTFDFLNGFISNFGWIILLLTIFIKLIIFPFTYKSYMSMAKMRLLKPELDAIGAKYPNKDDAMKRQQASMELYSRAGVSPLSGCLPLLLQLPVLIAMFRFFPASIELRGEHFLWSTDLSSYDSILQLPFSIPFYGDHVSLFALLMGLSMFASSKINMANNPSASSQQMPGMTFMTLYLMPILLVVWFNNYSSGLSYYYLLTNLITIVQMMLFRHFVSDEKLHLRMKENAKKPRKKSKWMTRYEEMVKEQQRQQRRK